MEYINLFYPDSSSWGGSATFGYFIGDPEGEYAFFKHSGDKCVLVHARPDDFRSRVSEALGRLDYIQHGNAIVEFVAQDLGIPWGTEYYPRVAAVLFEDARAQLREYEVLAREYWDYLMALVAVRESGAFASPRTAAIDAAAGTSLDLVLRDMRRICFAGLSCAYAAADACFYEVAHLTLEDDELANTVGAGADNPIERWRSLFVQLNRDMPELDHDRLLAARDFLQSRNDVTHAKHRRRRTAPRIQKTQPHFMGEPRQTIRDDFVRFPSPETFSTGLNALWYVLVALGQAAGVRDPL